MVEDVGRRVVDRGRRKGRLGGGAGDRHCSVWAHGYARGAQDTAVKGDVPDAVNPNLVRTALQRRRLEQHECACEPRRDPDGTKELSTGRCHREWERTRSRVTERRLWRRLARGGRAAACAVRTGTCGEPLWVAGCSWNRRRGRAVEPRVIHTRCLPWQRRCRRCSAHVEGGAGRCAFAERRHDKGISNGSKRVTSFLYHGFRSISSAGGFRTGHVDLRGIWRAVCSGPRLFANCAEIQGRLGHPVSAPACK